MTSHDVATADPIVRLEHDHSHVSALVTSLRDALAGARSREFAELQLELAEILRLLRDDLFGHFATEEEGLFPLVIDELPDLEPLIADVVAAHDRICGAVSRMTHLVDKGAHAVGGEIEMILTLFQRFDEAYLAHARDELELFRVLDRRLSSLQRAAVARILKEL